VGEIPFFIQSPQNSTHNPLGKGRVLGIEKNILKLWNSGDKGRLNSSNTIIPNIFFKVSGDSGFGRNYPH
jgi:hypothetical protein